jgi:hypothetical protein
MLRVNDDIAINDEIDLKGDSFDEIDSQPSVEVEQQPIKRKKKKRRLNFRQGSNPIPNDEVDKPSIDPTKAGRRKKNRRVKKSNESRSATINSCISNPTELIKAKYNSKLQRAHKHTVHYEKQSLKYECSISSSTSCKLCNNVCKPRENPGFLALDALKRIITGKIDDNDENNICEGEDEGENDTSQDIDNDIECDEFEKQNLKNPLIFRNIVIRQSGALPFLSRAMAESLEAAVLLFNLADTSNQSSSEMKGCTNCLEYLRERVQSLASIIDTLCCLSAENRRILCSTGMDVESLESVDSQNPILIPSLLRVMTSISIAPSNGNKKVVFPDIGLASFRTLTSITHENDLAGIQLTKYYSSKNEGLIDCNGSVHGIEVLSKILYFLVNVQQETRDRNNTDLVFYQQNVYDAIVFTLNMLTNVMETSSSHNIRKVMHGLNVKANDNNEPLSTLSWLSRWVVSQTSTFQDAVIMDCFGERKNDMGEDSQQRDLEHHEDEFLIQAGNGFILLACFLIGGNDNELDLGDVSLDKKIREAIMVEMPSDDDGKSRGMALIVNTLKAFCNFYRYSIGELSVAVVDPVLKLISKLEKVM